MELYHMDTGEIVETTETGQRVWVLFTISQMTRKQF
jgi:hypothetical protein